MNGNLRKYIENAGWAVGCKESGTEPRRAEGGKGEWAGLGWGVLQSSGWSCCSWTSVLSGTVNSGFLISQLMAPSKKTQRGRSKGLTDIAEDFSKDFSLSKYLYLYSTFFLY